MSNFAIYPGAEEGGFKKAFDAIIDNKVIERIWKKDHTVWSENPTEISNRLGWLDSPDQAKEMAGEINSFVEEIRKEGFETALLLGMGGSSLAPEVFSRVIGTKNGYLNLSVLDSTHPDMVARVINKLNPEKTLYIVSTKSGGTIETISFMKFFYNYVSDKLGREEAGRHFLAITDPGSGLEDYACKLNFRKIFLNNPDIGGRFSAVSMFGLVPAALIGADISRLLRETFSIMEEAKKPSAGNSAAEIGALVGCAAQNKRDKLTFVISDSLAHFGVWVEQLIAESTGKIGKGILPIEREKVLLPERYKNDRLFVYLRKKGETQFQNEIEKIMAIGFPVISIELDDEYRLCAEFFRWEFATAVTGCIIKVQPFDQPDVESAKIIARETIKKYQEEGKLEKPETFFSEKGIEVITDANGTTIKDVLKEVLGSHLNRETGYVAIHSYTKDSVEVEEKLQALRSAIQEKYNTATTVGYGPRFLHSTGQLHKGDAGNGVFIQIVDEGENDFGIPEEPGGANSLFSFKTLVSAQSIGDRQALLNNGRKVICFTTRGNVINAISILIENL